MFVFKRIGLIFFFNSGIGFVLLLDEFKKFVIFGVFLIINYELFVINILIKM